MAWYVGRALALLALVGLVLALALQHASVHEFLFRSEVVEDDEDVTLFPTIARFVDDPSAPLPSVDSSAAGSSRSRVKSKVYRHAAKSEKIANDLAEPGADGAVGQDAAAAAEAATSDDAECERRYVRVGIHGCIYEEEAGDYLNWALMKLAGMIARRYDYSDALENPLFRHRLSRFLVDNEGSKRVTVYFPLTNGSFGTYPLTRLSATNGHFEDQIVLDVGCAGSEGAQQDDGRGVPVIENFNGFKRIRYFVLSQDNRTFHGHSFIVEEEGISFISDIDDTIKVTGVTNGNVLFENTMLKDFAFVKGMNHLYNHWKTKYTQMGHDVQFHYVSGGPWQFYPVLQEFLHSADAAFPEGTWHLNQIFRDLASFMTFIRSPLIFKVEVIKPLIESFPHRKFVLVGDDGQQDPEVYAEIAEAFPDQVLHVFIHHVNGTNEARLSSPRLALLRWILMQPLTWWEGVPSTAQADGVTSYSVAEPGLQRCQKAFARLPEDKWTLFSDAQLDTLDDKEFAL